MRKMENKYKGLVAFDLDNTLLDHRSWRIPASAVRGIRELKGNGYLTVIATGRNMHDRYSEKYLKIIGSDALVHMNGTRVELRAEAHTDLGWQTGELLTDHIMERELLERILRFSEERGISVGACIEDKDYFTMPSHVIKHDMDYWGSSERDFRDPYELLELPVRALAYCGGRDGGEVLQRAFPELHVFMFSEHTGADVFDVGYSKLDGLRVLAEHFNIPWSESYAFGDSFNDKSMIEGVSCGVAVGNAVQAVKDCADYITEPINEDGIWRGLKHLGLI